MQINEIIKRLINKDITIIKFIEELTQGYAKDFNVDNCSLTITKFEDEYTLRGNNPAFFKDGTIYIREDVVQDGNIARILKLVSHEWMHYYVWLAENGKINNKNICERYKDLVIEASKKMMPKIHIEIMKFLKAFEKLSAEESVADKFAQDILKSLYNDIKIDDLKNSLQYQIDSHNKQIENMQEIINKNPELDKYTKKMMKKLKK